MFRVLFLKNGTANSAESFIDNPEYNELTKESVERITRDAAEWIVERYNKGEQWTAEIVQIISKIERTGGTAPNGKNEKEKG